MKNQIFRKKSIEHISDPEQLDAYVRVVNPSVWLILIAIITLLLGVIIWGSVTSLNTTISPVVVAEHEKVVMYVKDTELAKIEIGMCVELEETTCTIVEIAKVPVLVDEEFSDAVLYFGELQQGDWVYEVYLDIEIPEGIYKSKVVVESVLPISFILN